MTTSMSAAIKRLDAKQSAALNTTTSTVVLAGPGSGKTDTIVLKVADLLHHHVAAPRGVACLTYGNDAVSEFTDRLRKHDIRPQQRLFLGTAHSFCMQKILRPYAALCDRPDLTRPRLLSNSEQLQLRQAALDQVRSNEHPAYFEPTLTRIRRAIACGEDLGGFDERHIDVAGLYDKALRDLQAVDFEAMTLNALLLLSTNSDLSDLIAARYPWIAVDEYQDLGGPLHQLVLCLHDAGVNIFAVGDPDQCIFGFTGADPAYLNELDYHPEFTSIHLEFNYRSGANLIAAAQASLGERRPYRSNPEQQDAGVIKIENIPGGLDHQARHVVRELLPSVLASGTPPEQIAILYNRQGPTFRALLDEIESSQLNFRVERDIRFPNGPAVRWLRQLATRAITPDAGDSLEALMVGHPARYAGPRPDGDLDLRQTLLDAVRPVGPDTPLHDWISKLDVDLDLSSQLATTSDTDAIEALEQLSSPADPPIELAEFAQGLSVAGRVVITTCHSAKGRQFDVVIIPGLQHTLFPNTRWINGQHVLTDIAGDRRLFYVAITRARYQVHLLHSSEFTNDFGYAVRGRSQFIDEIATQVVSLAT